jgi:hypothetical protein
MKNAANATRTPSGVSFSLDPTFARKFHAIQPQNAAIATSDTAQKIRHGRDTARGRR